jgi:hypothetical protein
MVSERGGASRLPRARRPLPRVVIVSRSALVGGAYGFTLFCFDTWIFTVGLTIYED